MSKENTQHYTSSQVRTGGSYASVVFNNGDILCIDNAQISLPDGSTPASNLPKIKGVVSSNMLMPDPVNNKLFSINLLNQYRWLPVNFNQYQITSTLFTNTEHGMIYYFPCRVRIGGFWFNRGAAGNVHWSMRVYDFDIASKLPTTIIYSSPVINVTAGPPPPLYEHTFVPFAVDLEPGFYVISLILYSSTSVGISSIGAANRTDVFAIHQNGLSAAVFQKFVRGFPSSPPPIPFNVTQYSAFNPLMSGPLIQLI